MAVRDLSDMTADQVKETLRELTDLGEVALKADLYPWQESFRNDQDVLKYDPTDPTQHRI